MIRVGAATTAAPHVASPGTIPADELQNARSGKNTAKCPPQPTRPTSTMRGAREKSVHVLTDEEKAKAAMT